MTTPSVIIIGAGLAGLSAGCYAQGNGFRSQIFEHHSAPGGVAAAWRRGHYLVDGGIHFLMGHRPGPSVHDLYRELGIPQACRFVDLRTLGCWRDETTGRQLELTDDLDHLAAQAQALSPGDARFTDALVAGARKMQGLDLSQVGLSQPPEMTTPWAQLREMWGIRRLWRFFSGPYARSMKEFCAEMESPWLRRCLETLFLPETPVWFVLMLLAMLADGQLGLLEDGSLAFARAIEQRYQALGGQVTYRATVDKVLVEGDRAVGVRLADGSEHRADAVISAADGHSTVFDLLGGRYADQGIRQRYDAWPLVRPAVTVSLGVRRLFADQAPFQTVALAQPLGVAGSPCPELMLRLFNYSPRFAPAGKTVLQVWCETDWEPWRALADDRPRYQAEKDRLLAGVVAALERLYPGLAAQVEMTDVATPYTVWRYTRNWRGAYMAWLFTPQFMQQSIRRTLPGLQHFYMAGQWVIGGGVSSALTSGRHAVQLLCRQQRQPFHLLTR
ncbi:MAG: NAD(P)/FAD-dependent oxidoreductase [Chloroflexi bacterium]|nr:NAD(P)/FAD-dependent oxidoreductase [Chloroflexota bacterium]